MVQIVFRWLKGDLAAGLDEARGLVASNPGFWPGPPLAAGFSARLDMPEVAAEMRKRVLREDPRFSAAALIRLKGLTAAEQRDMLRHGLCLAGLSE